MFCKIALHVAYAVSNIFTLSQSGERMRTEQKYDLGFLQVNDEALATTTALMSGSMTDGVTIPCAFVNTLF
jgi:hypothetical protein